MNTINLMNVNRIFRGKMKLKNIEQKIQFTSRCFLQKEKNIYFNYLNQIFSINKI